MGSIPIISTKYKEDRNLRSSLYLVELVVARNHTKEYLAGVQPARYSFELTRSREFGVRLPIISTTHYHVSGKKETPA